MLSWPWRVLLSNSIFSFPFTFIRDQQRNIEQDIVGEPEQDRCEKVRPPNWPSFVRCEAGRRDVPLAATHRISAVLARPAEDNLIWRGDHISNKDGTI